MTPNLNFESLLQLNETSEVFPLWASIETKNTTAIIKHRDPEDLSSDRLISGVSLPETMVYRPSTPNGIGIVVFPGGSYQRISIDNEGRDVGKALTELGYTIFVCTYRMPGEGHHLGSETSLADAQRAIRWVRAHAKKWNLHTIGVLGFSAGGHLAGQLATRFNVQLQASTDDIDAQSARPDFCGLMYPVITMNEQFGHKGSAYELLGQYVTESELNRYSIEKCVHNTMPPCFLVHANDDQSVPVENSVLLWNALRKSSIDVEMHLFNEGGHGFGIKGVETKPAGQWPVLFSQWIKFIGKN